MSACEKLDTEQSRRYTIGCAGHLIGGKSGENSWVLPVQSAYDVFWKKKIEPYDLSCKDKGANQAINLGVPYGVDYIPTGEEVLDAFKACPFVRVSSILKRKGTFGSGEMWHTWRNPQKYAFQIDKDDCTQDEMERLLAFGKRLGANGAITREVKPGLFSVNVVFHFSDYMYKKQALEVVDSVLDLLKKEEGISVCMGGSKNDLIKNLWGVKTLVETYEMGLRLAVRSWDEVGARGGLKERHYWFVREDSGEMRFDPILRSQCFVWKAGCVGSWFWFRGLVEKRSEGVKSVENEPSPSTIQDRETIAENLKPTTTQFVPPPQKTKKTPMEHFGSYQDHSHDCISVLWWPDLKATVRKNGKLLKTEYDRIYAKWEKTASNMLGKKVYSLSDRTWKERNWRTLSKKPLTWWEERIGEVSYPTLRRKAGKLIRIACMAIDTNADGLLKDVAEKRLVEDDVCNSVYIQSIIRKKVGAKATLAEYRKVIKDPVRWVSMADEVLLEVEGVKKTEGEEFLFSLIKDMKGSLEEGKQREEEEGRESVENEPAFLDKIQKRIKTLETQTEGEEKYNEPQPKWTAEDETWLHVEKVDNFDHLNTDLENRMMGRDYIRDAEKYHNEGLFGLRDEAVHAARSYGYIGGFSWESEKTSLDWAGIHRKVFGAEETPKEPKTPKATVSFADIKARLDRMKRAGNA